MFRKQRAAKASVPAFVPFEQPRRARGFRLIWLPIAAVSVIGVVVVAILWITLDWAFEHYEVTSFAAELETTRMRFTAATAAVNDINTDAGLFAPSGVVDVLIDGCNALRSLDGVPIETHQLPHFHLETVRLETLSFGAGTEVQVSVVSGSARIWLKERSGARSIRAVFRVTREGREQEWVAIPAHTTLTLTLTEKRPGAIPGDTNILLAEGSAVYLESGDESSLVGSNNKLRIPRLGKEMDLRDSRMQLQNVRSARVRKITWNRSGQAFRSFNAVVTGRSDRIEVFSPYSDEPSNEALNWFDFYTEARRGRLLLTFATGVFAVAGAIAALFTVFGYTLAFAGNANALPQFLDNYFPERKTHK